MITLRHTDEPQRITFMQATTDDIQEEYDLSTSMFGDAIHDIPTRQAWLDKNPETDFLVRDQGRLVGFINMLPVKHETIMRSMQGDIRGCAALHPRQCSRMCCHGHGHHASSRQT